MSSRPPGVAPGDPWRRVRVGLILLGVTLVVGTAGYLVLGLDPLEAVYQTVTTVTTVGFRDQLADSRAAMAFTTVLALVGVGGALYTLGVLLETLVEGRLTDLFGRRRVQRQIDAMSGHVIVCGFGRVGRVIATFVAGSGGDVVVVDQDPDRLAGLAFPHLVGDATDDAVLVAAGIHRASTLVAALDGDAENLYVTLSGRGMRQDLFIVARSRLESAEAKFLQAGANRVVNPQQIGGARIAAFALQPHVAEFLDVVMHDGSLEFRLAEVPLTADSPLAGTTIRDAHIRDRTGALVLALRSPDGRFHTNPPPDTPLHAGQVVIAIGTVAQLAALSDAASGLGSAVPDAG